MSAVLDARRVAHIRQAASHPGALRPGSDQPEQRLASLEALRMSVDALQHLAAAVRRHWPERYPVPEDIDALLSYVDYAIQRVRRGDVRQAGLLLEDIDK